MASSNSQRVAAFLLAGLFFISTVGFTGYLLLVLNSDDTGIVPEENVDTSQVSEETSGELACGQTTYPAEEPRDVPEVVTAPTPVEELEIVDVEEGTGEEVQAGDCVAALYYGTLASDGSTFDGNYDTGVPIEFSLNEVIAGWTQGIPGMKVGGVRRLVIPAEQAYGETERPGIPAGSDLVFEVNIVATKRGE